MKALKLSGIVLVAILAFSGGSRSISESQTSARACTMPNTAFKPGEKVSFSVAYTVGKVTVNAGIGSFAVTDEKLNGKSVYHVLAQGRTLPSYEWAYKVNDTYETYMDAETLQPLKFVRNISEGSYKKYQNVSFNKSASTAITNDGVYKTTSCVHDVVSAVFYARNIDYSKLRVNDRVSIDLFLDNEMHSMYVRYLGKETISTKYGKFKAIKIKPLTIKGTIFDGGEKMTVWITDDDNRVPIRVESPIIVGKVRIDMTDFSNLRSPMTALIKKN
ncbi:MAG: DUF3108 domain-containing protein [Niabella sp.]